MARPTEPRPSRPAARKHATTSATPIPTTTPVLTSDSARATGMARPSTIASKRRTAEQRVRTDSVSRRGARLVAPEERARLADGDDRTRDEDAGPGGDATFL